MAGVKPKSDVRMLASLKLLSQGSESAISSLAPGLGHMSNHRSSFLIFHEQQ
jgi:hypothetical protein